MNTWKKTLHNQRVEKSEQEQTAMLHLKIGHSPYIYQRSKAKQPWMNYECSLDCCPIKTMQFHSITITKAALIWKSAHEYQFYWFFPNFPTHC